MRTIRLPLAAGGLTAAGACLAVLAPPGRLLGELGAVGRAPQAGVDLLGADAVAVSVVAALAWAAFGWLLVAAGSVAASTLPGRLGASASRLSGAVAPAAARRLLAGLLGVTLLTGVGTAAAHADPAGPPPVIAVAQLDLDWPVVALPRSSAGPPARAPSVPTGTPGVPPTPSAPSATPGGSQPQTAPPTSRSRPTAAAAPGPPAAEVVVLRGASLWSIAKAHLGADATDREVAAEWPRWWVANRAVVGDDPDLLLPGQRLKPPGPRR